MKYVYMLDKSEDIFRLNIYKLDGIEIVDQHGFIKFEKEFSNLIRFDFFDKMEEFEKVSHEIKIKESEYLDSKEVTGIHDVIHVPTMYSQQNVGNELEICKYYPNCIRGEGCMFQHVEKELEICKFYPNCTRGESCIFLHVGPEIEQNPDINKETIYCKFYPNCTREDCPYPHPKSKKNDTLCPNYPLCNDQHCDYLHPEPVNLYALPEICSHYPNCTKGDYCDYMHIDL